MKILRDILICVALIALAAFLVRGALLFQSAERLTDSGAKVASGVDLMRVTLQSQLLGKTGVVEELRQVLLQSRKTIDVLQKTSLAERAKVAAFSDASIQVVHNLDATVRSGTVAVQGMQEAIARLGGVAVALQSDAEAARPVLEGATALVATLNSGSGQALGRLQGALGDVDVLVKNAGPIEKNFEDTSASIAHGGSGADRILTDAAEYVHALVHPRKRGFWSEWAVALLGPGARVIIDHLWPIRVKVIKTKGN